MCLCLLFENPNANASLYHSMIVIATLALTAFHPGYCFPFIGNAHRHRLEAIESLVEITPRSHFRDRIRKKGLENITTG